MLEFNIQIAGGSLVEINEPIGFDKVDFNLTRSESLHSLSSNFAGNSIEFEFNKDVHINVFNAIIQEYAVNGFLGDVMLFITYNSTELFKGSFDFSTTQTDMLNYLKCQIVNKDKLYLLDKNKGVAIDLLSDKGLDQNTVTPAQIDSIGLPPIVLKKESIWEDKEVKLYSMIGSDSFFNNAQNTTKYEINNSVSWMSEVEPSNPGTARRFMLVSAKENLSNVRLKIEYSSGSGFFDTSGNPVTIQLILLYGNERPDLNDTDWLSQVTNVVLYTKNFTGSDLIPNLIEYNLPDIPRGNAIWLMWQIQGGGISPKNMLSNGTKITINADSKNYYSVNNAIFYKDLVANAVKKIANIQNIVWNVNYYNATMAFNGNLLRYIQDKGFDIKWQDIAKQLDERNLGAYYVESTDTLVIDHRNNILGTNLIGTYGDLAKKDFYFVTEDEKFIVNKFSYKYSKFQALKENSVDGNYSSVHGESEWYIANKTFEGSISVDLPFIRDSFMIEDIRQKALAYKEDTATNEDSTIVLMESILNDDGTSNRITVTESITVSSSYDADNNIQSFLNDGSFNWYLIGISSVGIYINGQYYFIEESTPTLLKATPGVGSPTYNGVVTLEFEYVLITNYLGKTDNGLYNQDFSVRQNIQYWRNTLDTANFYSKTDIINTIYKENKEAVINGLKETQPIDYLNALHTPRIIDTKVMISVDDYFYLKNNKIGYISIYNHNNELINIYLTELKALFLNGCNMMEATLKGWLKN